MTGSRFIRIALAMIIVSSGLMIALSAGLAASPSALDVGRVHLPVINPRPIATEPPAGDLLLQGRVYDRLAGPLSGIEGAQVAIISCIGGMRYSTITLPDGAYALIIPQAYVNPCTELVLEASAPGYAPQSAALSVADLRANPRQNIALQRASTATPTVTPTPGGDLTIQGTVYRAGVASGGEIAGALVSAEACVSTQRRETISQANGAYSLTLPAAYLGACDTVRLQAFAAGYYAYSISLAVAELRQTPRHDIYLTLPKTQPPPP